MGRSAFSPFYSSWVSKVKPPTSVSCPAISPAQASLGPPLPLSLAPRAVPLTCTVSFPCHCKPPPPPQLFSRIKYNPWCLRLLVVQNGKKVVEVPIQSVNRTVPAVPHSYQATYQVLFMHAGRQIHPGLPIAFAGSVAVETEVVGITVHGFLVLLCFCQENNWLSISCTLCATQPIPSFCLLSLHSPTWQYLLTCLAP